MDFTTAILTAYLLGSIPTGKILGRIKGIDIQRHGSGNIGFANAVRVLGWRLGLVVLIVDVVKGAIPVLIAINYFEMKGYALLIVCMLTIIGHAFPVWLNFKGGKSIATGFGTALVLVPYGAIFAAFIYTIVFVITRMSAIGSLTAAWSLPLICFFVYPGYGFFTLFLAFFATFTHRSNIRKLLNK